MIKVALDTGVQMFPSSLKKPWAVQVPVVPAANHTGGSTVVGVGQVLRKFIRDAMKSKVDMPIMSL
jgi:hypothetical protein